MRTFSKVEVNGKAPNSQVHRSKLFQVKPQTVKSPQMQKRVKTQRGLQVIQPKCSACRGAYTMVESQAPAGYDLAESITFRVTADGQVEVKGTDGSWTVQADAIIKMEDAKTPVIPEKTVKYPNS